MKKEKFFAFRIKDMQTGLYYEKEYWRMDIERTPSIKDLCQYKYSPAGWSNSERYLKFSQKGHLFKTKLGAERKISGFNGNSIHDRKSNTAIILNCKFAFKVVKTEIKYKDVE